MRLTKDHKKDIMRKVLDALYETKVKKLDDELNKIVTDYFINHPDNKKAIAVYEKHKKDIAHAFKLQTRVSVTLNKHRMVTNHKDEKVRENYEGYLTLSNLVEKYLTTSAEYLCTNTKEMTGKYFARRRYCNGTVYLNMPSSLPLLSTSLSTKNDAAMHKIILAHEKKLTTLAKKICETVVLMNNILDTATTRKKLVDIAPDLAKYAPPEPPKEIKLVPLESVQKVTKMLKDRAEGKD